MADYQKKNFETYMHSYIQQPLTIISMCTFMLRISHSVNGCSTGLKTHGWEGHRRTHVHETSLP